MRFRRHTSNFSVHFYPDGKRSILGMLTPGDFQGGNGVMNLGMSGHASQKVEFLEMFDISISVCFCFSFRFLELYLS